MFLFLVSIIEFGLGAALHFVYDMLPYPVIASFAPINESIFEHVKLVFYSMLIIGIFVMVFIENQTLYTPTSLLIGTVISMLLMFMIYYFYRYGFGIESMFYDVMLLLAVQLIGNVVSKIIFNHQFELQNSIVVWSYLIIIIFILLGTFMPPNIPMFIEGNPIY